MPVSEEAVIWGYRLVLGRDPESEKVIVDKMQLEDSICLLRELLESQELVVSGRRDLLFPNLAIANHKPEAAAPLRITEMEDGRSSISLCDLPRHCFRHETAAKMNGTVIFPAGGENSLGQISLGYHGGDDPVAVSGILIDLKSFPQLYVDIADSNQVISFGENCTGAWVFRLWGECNISIGNNVTSNGVECMVNPGGKLVVGEDCMFANAFIHVGDNHAVIDLDSGQLINYSDHPQVLIKEHVWIASRVAIFADTLVESGSILGAGAIVKGNFPGCALIVGVPARPVREGVSWTRNLDGSAVEDVIDRFRRASEHESEQRIGG